VHHVYASGVATTHFAFTSSSGFMEAGQQKHRFFPPPPHVMIARMRLPLRNASILGALRRAGHMTF